MTTADPLDNPNTRYAVAAAIGYAACEMDPDTTDDDVLAIQSSWPTNISLEAMLIAKETAVALAVFAGLTVDQLYKYGRLAMPDGA